MEEAEAERREEVVRVRVLVVDDSLMDRKIVERLIKRSDDIFEVITVDSGKKALEVLGLPERKDLPMVNDQKIDIVLTDYCMPEMKGYELLKVLKEHSCLRSMPVVMMSSENDVQRIARCLAMGAEDFMLKPLQNKHVQSLRLYALPKAVSPSLQSTKPDAQRKLPRDLMPESGGSERRPCLAGVAVA